MPADLTITIQPTPQLVVKGQQCLGRVWKGTTPNGVRVELLVNQLRVNIEDPQEELQAELLAIRSEIVPFQTGEWTDPIDLRLML